MCVCFLFDSARMESYNSFRNNHFCYLQTDIHSPFQPFPEGRVSFCELLLYINHHIHHYNHHIRFLVPCDISCDTNCDIIKFYASAAAAQIHSFIFSSFLVSQNVTCMRSSFMRLLQSFPLFSSSSPSLSQS